MSVENPYSREQLTSSCGGAGGWVEESSSSESP